MEEKGIQFNLNAELEKRKGSYSNFQTVIDGDQESVLDFYFIDQSAVDDSGQTVKNGIIVSRIILTKHGLTELKDMLVKHIEKMDCNDEGKLSD